VWHEISAEKFNDLPGADPGVGLITFFYSTINLETAKLARVLLSWMASG
jgi:hypothetical protein